MTQNGTASIVGAPGCNLSAGDLTFAPLTGLNLQVPSSNHIDVMVNVCQRHRRSHCAPRDSTECWKVEGL